MHAAGRVRRTAPAHARDVCKTENQRRDIVCDTCGPATRPRCVQPHDQCGLRGMSEPPAGRFCPAKQWRGLGCFFLPYAQGHK